ncbi:MAG: DNA replication and repair protein RecF [Verrucomicrobiae bacterium]
MLTDLRLRDFRCFDSLEFSPGRGRTFVSGKNAQGKTSILEAICILLRLQSPCTSAAADAIKFGRPGFSLDGHSAGTHLICRYSPAGREITLDSKPQSRTEDYLDVARVAWFANSDLELVRGGGSVRRRYLDFLGAQCLPSYRKSLRAYERALRSRNALLKDGRPRREIEAFDQPLAESGEVLLSSRASLAADLAPLARQACLEISAGEDGLEIAHRPGSSGPLSDALAASRAEEERLRQTVVGPHRDDLAISLNHLDAARFSSEGQQRGIALSLKLAQARHLEAVQRRAPVLLLDDVFGELDRPRRNRLLESLPAQSQAIITTTFLDWAERSAGDSVFRLESGRLEC